MSISRAFFALLCCAAFLRPNESIAQSYEGKELVQAEIVADTSAIVPGKTFHAGILLKQAPNWHTYWKFPGDAGIPTEIKWNLPAGWKVGAIQWPIPLELDEPGDILIYGYHDEVLLMQEITPPAKIAETSVKLSAEATWLVCEKICIPGSAKLEKEIPVGQNAAPANQELFAKFQRSLPQAWPNQSVASASWVRSGAELRLTVASAALANYPAIEFFPLPEANVVVGHVKSEPGKNGERLFHIPIETTDAKLSSINGVLVFGQTVNGAERNAWSLSNSNAGLSAVISPAVPAASNGLAKFLLFGFIGGFILNLMPCVLPVISLKIFGFVQHAGQSRARILRSGLAFIAGIFAWFIGLAILLIALKSAGHELTWAFQFTNPYFVVAMSAVVLVFALNLFGVFEITLPQSATRGALGLSAQEGDLGSFFQGVLRLSSRRLARRRFLGRRSASPSRNRGSLFCSCSSRSRRE